MTLSTARKIIAIPRLSLTAVFRWYLDADAKFRDRCHMNELTDEQLDDVGLCRDRIGKIVRQ